MKKHHLSKGKYKNESLAIKRNIGVLKKDYCLDLKNRKKNRSLTNKKSFSNVYVRRKYA